MGRKEEPREDILREATGLVPRLEVQVPGCSDVVTVGFRRQGEASFFFGQDVVFQFNSEAAIRRAYVAGRLIKANRGVLIWLDRERTENSVLLRATAMTPDESRQFLQLVENRLQGLKQGFADDSIQVLRQVPDGSAPQAQLVQWLERNRPPFRIATRPHVR